MRSPRTYKYAAFITYSSKDARFATRLHAAIESYRIPSLVGSFDLLGCGTGKRNRVYPVFLDRQELPAGELSKAIGDALADSDSLIVVCSPSSVASLWVNREITSFIKSGRKDRIFAIISTDAPLVDGAGKDGTYLSFPASFRDGGRADDSFEPVAADARKGRDGFRNAWLKIVAGIIGVNPGALQDRDRKRTRRRLVSSVVVVGIVLSAAALAWINRSALELTTTSFWEFSRFADSRESLEQAAAGTVFQDCRTDSHSCPPMVILPEGKYLNGDPASSDRPVHMESVTRFAISRHEVTFAEWETCSDFGGCNDYRPDPNGWHGDNRPVVNVSRFDAEAYVKWLSSMTGQTYRLPKEVEWEFAARAVTSDKASQTNYSWGDESPVCRQEAPNGAAFGSPCEEREINRPGSLEKFLRDLFFDAPGETNDLTSRNGSTWPVESFRPNGFGLHDMHGNVWEWVDDCPDPRLSTRPTVPDTFVCQFGIIRGGGWGGPPTDDLRSAARAIVREPNNYRANNLGFRVVRVVSPSHIR